MFLRLNSSWVNLDQVCEACQRETGEIFARMSNGYVICLEGPDAAKAEIYFQRKQLVLMYREEQATRARINLSRKEFDEMVKREDEIRNSMTGQSNPK